MNSDIRKLQILNDVIAQTIDALERRAAAWGTPIPGVFDRTGMNPYGAAFGTPAGYGSVGATPWGYPVTTPFAAHHYGAYGMNPLTNMPALFGNQVPTAYPQTWAHPAAGAYLNGSTSRFGLGGPGGVQSVW